MFSPGSHDVIIIIVRQKRYTCAVPSVYIVTFSCVTRNTSFDINHKGNDKTDELIISYCYQ